MSLWVKICANTNLEDAQLAADLGADAVGFVFAPSKRRVTAEQVAAITQHLPADVEKIGVFPEGDAGAIAAVVRAAGLTGAQLHFAAPGSLVSELRGELGRGVRIIRVVHFAVGEPAPLLTAFEPEDDEDAVLVDAKNDAGTGGTGLVYDWDQAANTLFHASRKPMIAAGGLTPENVAEAIWILRPWGVDVASGVEAAPGRKDAAKLRAFIANARAAERDDSGE